VATLAIFNILANLGTLALFGHFGPLGHVLILALLAFLCACPSIHLHFISLLSMWMKSWPILSSWPYSPSWPCVHLRPDRSIYICVLFHSLSFSLLLKCVELTCQASWACWADVPSSWACWADVPSSWACWANVPSSWAWWAYVPSFLGMLSWRAELLGVVSLRAEPPGML